jgi:ketosteroid isomerase-like protein
MRFLTFILLAALAPSPMMLGQTTTPAKSPDTGSPEIREMQQVEDAWDAAVDKHDQYALENVLAAQFVGISAGGDVTTRNQQVAHLFVAGAEPVSLTQKVIGARVFGDIAVVNGTYVMQWKGGGEKVAEKGIFTHVFRRANGGAWQCINSQRTVVADETEQRKKAAAPRSKSNADLPLHVPLVYKGPQSTQTPPKSGTAEPQP